MNKTLLNTISLCAAAVLSTAGLSAQTQDVRLGFCNGDKLGASIRAQGTETDDNELGAAIYISKDILKKYVGDTIYQVSYANTDKVGSSMTVFIKNDLYSKQGIVQTVRDHHAGWNNITLKKPYVITGEEGIYVGYVAYPNHIEADNSEILTMEFNSGGTPDVDWYGMNGQWWKTKVDLINYDFCIRAYAKGNNKPPRDLGLDRIDNYNMVRQNTPTTMSVQITNYGLDTVDGFTIEARKDGQTFATKQVAGVALAHNEMKKVDIDGFTFPLEGNNDFTVNITGINGGADTDTSDNVRSSYAYVVPENAEAQERKILLEEFTTTKNGESLLADSVYNIAVSDRGDVIWVKYHMERELPGVSSYSWFFDSDGTFTPAMMIDREEFTDMENRGPAYFVKYNELLTYLLDQCSSIPTFATVDVSAALNDAHTVANIKAKVESQVKEMPHQKSLRMTLLAVEDSVELTSGLDKENGIVRKFINGAWGDQVDVSNHADSITANLDIDPSWNVNNMRIVAFLSNYDSSQPLNCAVFNSAQCQFGITDGIYQTTVQKLRPTVFCDGKAFSTANGFKVVAVYNQAGQQVDNNGLQRGLYLVKVTDGVRTSTVKYVVR